MEEFKPHSEDEVVPEKESKESLEVPLINATLKRCEKIDDRPEVIEKIRLFLEEYLSQEIENTRIFTSEKHNASFAYTVVKLGDIARAIYDKLGLPEPHASPDEQPKPDTEPKDGNSIKEVIFGTSFSVDVGHHYHWIEHGMDKIARKIPEALRRIGAGEEPEDIEIYGVGSPSGELGSVSAEFLESIGDQPFEKMGELYAEFVNSLDSKGSIDLWGVSMGASMAATTAASLLEQGRATQSYEESKEKQLPTVRAVMYAPAGTNTSFFRKLQIPLGFGMEAVYSLISDSYAKEFSGEAQKAFIAQMNEAFAKKGIAPKISGEDLERKKALVQKSLRELFNGVPIPEGLKTNEVIGKYDPLLYGQGHESEGDRRKFGIRMTHTPAIVRENYFKRLVGMGEKMNKLSKQ